MLDSGTLVKVYQIFYNEELFICREVGPDDEYDLIGTNYTWSVIDSVWYRRTMIEKGQTKIYTRERIMGGIEEIISDPNFPSELLWHINDLKVIAQIEYKFGSKK